MSKMVADGKAICRLGTVTSYSAADYTVKVSIQPDAVDTGWLPVGAMWAGSGWGMFAPPSQGNQAMVFFQEADELVGICAFVLFSDEDQPLSVQSGEFWLVHQSGTFIKLTNDQNLALNSAADITIVAAGAVTLTAPSGLTINADTAINGNVTISGDFSFSGSGSLAGGGQAVARVGDSVSGGVITSGSGNVQSG